MPTLPGPAEEIHRVVVKKKKQGADGRRMAKTDGYQNRLAKEGNTWFKIKKEGGNIIFSCVALQTDNPGPDLERRFIRTFSL
jgi:hypothetical protein